MSADLLLVGAEERFAQERRANRGRIGVACGFLGGGVAYASTGRSGAVGLGIESSNGWTTSYLGTLNGAVMDALRSQLPDAEEDDE